MKLVKPSVYLVGESAVVEEGMQAYLKHIGVPGWTSDAPSGGEKLVEFYGRICYRSFEPGLNANVTKIREGNGPYLGNILDSKHGSVIEHPVVNFVFADVSPVFTQELVRHRVGIAISQESLRFVRLQQLSAWAPTVISENDQAMDIFIDTFEKLEELQLRLAELFRLDDKGVSFHLKKKVTSAMRRLAPIGLATTIGWSANFRALRWIIEARTAPGAEEEIRLVFGKVAELAIDRYPNVFAGFTTEIVDGLPHYIPRHSKV